MFSPRPLPHWLLLLALVAMWGSSFLFIKLAVAAFPPATVVASRLVIAAIMLLVILGALGRSLPGQRRLWVFLVAMAVVGNALPFTLISWGQQRIDSGLAGILMAPVTALVDHPWRLEIPLIAALAVAVLGLVLTALATVVYFRLIELAGPSFLSLNNYLISIWAVILGALVLSERPRWIALLALALVLSGIALSEVKPPLRRLRSRRDGGRRPA